MRTKLIGALSVAIAAPALLGAAASNSGLQDVPYPPHVAAAASQDVPYPPHVAGVAPDVPYPPHVVALASQDVPYPPHARS